MTIQWSGEDKLFLVTILEFSDRFNFTSAIAFLNSSILKSRHHSTRR